MNFTRIGNFFGQLFTRNKKKEQEALAKAFASFKEEIQFTPDINELEQKLNQFVFVYDSLMERNKDNSLLGQYSERLYTAFTTFDKFIMYKKEMGENSIPVILWNLSKTAKGFGELSTVGYPARIKGEVWAVRSYQIRHIDKHLQNGVMFKRKLIPVTITCHEFDPRTDSSSRLNPPINYVLWAWAYIGVPRYWRRQMEELPFSKVQLFTPGREERLDERYYFWREAIEARKA